LPVEAARGVVVATIGPTRRGTIARDAESPANTRAAMSVRTQLTIDRAAAVVRLAQQTRVEEAPPRSQRPLVADEPAPVAARRELYWTATRELAAIARRLVNVIRPAS